MWTVIYAGSFDPVTEGHLSVVRQAARLFGHVVVLVAVNPEKRALFSPDERVALLSQAVAELPNVSTAQTTGLVIDYARRVGAQVLLRGIRGASDAQFETALAQANRELAPELATLFLPASAELSEISSSGLKALAREGRDLSRYCPPHVAARLTEKLHEVKP